MSPQCSVESSVCISSDSMSSKRSPAQCCTLVPGKWNVLHCCREKKVFVISWQKINAVMMMMGMQCDYLMHGGNLGNGGQQ